MLIDARDVPDGAVVEGDVCIVGAGAAGITLASELGSAGVAVCVLESGGLAPDPATQALCRGENAGDPYFPLDGNRQRAFGGTTNLWTGWCRPLDDLDFEPRPWIPDSGWPVRKADLLAYYHRAHPLCGLGPFEYDPGFWEARLGGARLPLPPERVVTQIYQLSPTVHFGRAYRPRLAEAPSVTVYLHATVLEILTSATGGSVSGLQVGVLAGGRFSARATYFVLATGGIENARLLLLSRQGERQGIGNEHDLVGRYFMEHLHCSSAALALSDPRPAALALYWQQARRVVGRLFLSRKAQEEEGLLNCSAGLNRTGPGLRPVAASALAALRESRHGRRSGWAARGSRLLAAIRGRRLHVHQTLEQAPSATSRLTLADELDPFGLRRVRLEWRTGRLEQDTLRRTRLVLDTELRRAGVGRLEIDPRDDDEWPPPPVQGSRGHHMGTTRMSLGPRRGVVDEHCRVHGVGNLFVAGSSIFPTSGAGTPTLTILAFAVRLADHLTTLLRTAPR